MVEGKGKGLRALHRVARDLYTKNFPCTYCGKKFNALEADSRGGTVVRNYCLVDSGKPVEVQCPHCLAWINYDEVDGAY